MWEITTVFIGIVSVLIFYRVFSFVYELLRRNYLLVPIPGPPVHPFIGFNTDIDFQHFHRYIDSVAKKYGEVAKIRLLAQNIVILSDPESWKEALGSTSPISTSYSKFDRPTFVRNVLSIAEMHHSLFGVQSAEWKKQRAILSPPFRTDSLKSSFGDMIKVSERYISELKKNTTASSPPCVRNVHSDFSNVALSIICLISFGYDVNTIQTGDSEFAGAIQTMFAHFHKFYTVPFPMVWRLLAYLRKDAHDLLAAIKHVHWRIDEILKTHKSGRKSGNNIDIISLLLQHHEGQTLSDKELRSNCFAFIVAGYETTAETLTWLFYYLARYPHIQDKIRKEVNTVTRGGKLTVDHLDSLKYTSSVIKETQRMKGPVHGTARQAFQDAQILNHFIPKGTILMTSFWSVHHNEKYFTNCEQFLPERWIQNPSLDSYFFPFGSGPRSCIARRFAIMEMLTLTSLVLSQFSVELTSQQEPEEIYELTIKPKGGMHLRFSVLPPSASSFSPPPSPIKAASFSASSSKSPPPSPLKSVSSSSLSSVLSDHYHDEYDQDRFLTELETND